MPLRRIALIAGIAAVLALAVFGVTRLQRKVEVTAGTRVVCTYGHTISDDSKPLMVPADKASLYRVKTVRRTCEKHAQLEKLYQEAQAALAKGDVKTAKSKLTKITQTDPAYAKAKQQLEAIAQGDKPPADTEESSPSTSTPKQTDPGTGGAVGLTAWVPGTIDGFSAQKPLVDAMQVARQYFPTASNNIVQVVIVAEQYKTATGAKTGLQEQVRSKYPQHADSVSVGSHSAYYGTDGNRFAVIGFTQGAVMVAVELGAKPGTDPQSLKGELVDVAKQLP